MADSFSGNSSPPIPLFLLLAGLVSVVWTADCFGQMRYPATPRYYPYTIALPQDRTWIRNLPMEKRPDRPLHFYGNRVRRSYNVQRSSYNTQPRVRTQPTRGRQTRL